MYIYDYIEDLPDRGLEAEEAPWPLLGQKWEDAQWQPVHWRFGGSSQRSKVWKLPAESPVSLCWRACSGSLKERLTDSHRQWCRLEFIPEDTADSFFFPFDSSQATSLWSCHAHWWLCPCYFEAYMSITLRRTLSITNLLGSSYSGQVEISHLTSTPSIQQSHIGNPSHRNQSTT